MNQHKVYSTDLWDWENDYKRAIEEESSKSRSEEEKENQPAAEQKETD